MTILSSQPYKFIAYLESRQKMTHFQKKQNLFLSPDVPIRSCWSCKNRDLRLAEKFRNRDLKPPAPMCRLWNSTPKQKKLLENSSSYEEDIAVWKSLLLLFFLNRGRAPKKQKALDFASDVRFGWNKIWSGGFLTFWIWCKYQICTSNLQSSPAKYLPYGLMANFFRKNNANPKKFVKRQMKKKCRSEN